ncbi:hypothetical protein EX895_003069 [Sporisorium graminicola]|uniref:SET domain-containing protein n=1 Tax=Sporisorium graminicola TaxID=280036 RepID=A0A4U7KTZ2_9BASI|nr:hypothetical protein EX895_003069 [Sporisorium graminicola]TKY87973.1 hypothetical protein EX895_003069 [Sporisorium graminicola]
MMPLRSTGPLASTSTIGSALPHLRDEPMDGDDSDHSRDRRTEHKMSFASKQIKALSILRSDPQFLEQTRSADVGQALQLQLATNPPKLFPENDGARLIDFFSAWVQEWELGMEGLAILNNCAANLGDVVPPWDFVWTDKYLCDPSVPPIDQIKPLEDVNGFKMTDELCVNKGCDCDDDECDPKTCACLRRAADCYPFADSYYQRMFAGSGSQTGIDGTDAKAPGLEFIYNADGRIRMKDVPVGTPIFECNKFCSCSASCKIRVVQKGKKVPLAFWKTESKGWGIKTLADLPAGTFVGSYGGELLNDQESERRADAYEKMLGTTYLQTVDSHIIMVHLTLKIIERDLAERNLLGHYRRNQRKLVELVTETAYAIEVYDDYLKFIQDDNKCIELGLHESEMRIREGTSDRLREAHIAQRAKELAEPRAREAAVRRRAQEEAHRDPREPYVPKIPITESDFEDPVWNFLSLSLEEQDRACALREIRSDLEDEHLVTVDSALWGNHTRFFNHSCDPNIFHVPVYTDDASILRPLLAFFTTREVKAGEELCFNYRGTQYSDDMPIPSSSSASTSALAPATPSKGQGRTRTKPTVIHPPSTKPGADTVAAITTSAAESAAAAAAMGRPPAGNRLDIRCRCGAVNCTGRVFN